MLYPFSALLARMKYITRWSLMHSTRAESLSEHTCDTALLAHTLCLIARRYTGTPSRHLPPNSWYRGMLAILPLMSHRAMSTPEIALFSMGPLRQ